MTTADLTPDEQLAGEFAENNSFNLRKRVIANLRQMRETHVFWLDFFRCHPEEESKMAAIHVGSSAHHREIVAQYDEVLGFIGDG